MINDAIPPDAAFSRAVYTHIRPAIPRAQWPTEALYATFTPAPDGLSLDAVFEGLPPQAAAQAAATVRSARVDLVLVSPVAALAARVVAIRRWRDTFLYGLLPLLFAIPLLATLGGTAMHAGIWGFAIDVLGLLASQAALLQGRSRLTLARFAARIPTPGLRIKVPQGTQLHRQDS